MSVNWLSLWHMLFGREELFGLNIGFWVSMGVVTLLVVIMNVVFWNMKPLNEGDASSVDVSEQLL